MTVGLGRAIKAEVMICQGRVNPAETYAALEIFVDGVDTPYHFIVQLPVIGYKELLEKGVDPLLLYHEMAERINRQ